MFKKIFNSKGKHQEQGKPKITLDQVSQAILSRHFSPLPSRAKSPSDVLDIVGYPLLSTTANTTSSRSSTRTKSVTFKNSYKPFFSQSSPELSTPLEKPYQLTVRNNISPSPPSSPPPPAKVVAEVAVTTKDMDNEQLLLLEASREEKTLVELDLESRNLEVYRLHQKLIELEKEREFMNQKFQDFMEREEQLKSIIEDQLNQLRYYGYPSRHNSHRTNSTKSWYSDKDYYYPRKRRYYYSYYPQQYYY